MYTSTAVQPVLTISKFSVYKIPTYVAHDGAESYRIKKRQPEQPRHIAHICAMYASTAMQTVFIISKFSVYKFREQFP